MAPCGTGEALSTAQARCHDPLGGQRHGALAPDARGGRTRGRPCRGRELPRRRTSRTRASARPPPTCGSWKATATDKDRLTSGSVNDFGPVISPSGSPAGLRPPAQRAARRPLAPRHRRHQPPAAYEHRRRRGESRVGARRRADRVRVQGRRAAGRSSPSSSPTARAGAGSRTTRSTTSDPTWSARLEPHRVHALRHAHQRRDLHHRRRGRQPPPAHRPPRCRPQPGLVLDRVDRVGPLSCQRKPDQARAGRRERQATAVLHPPGRSQRRPGRPTARAWRSSSGTARTPSST